MDYHDLNQLYTIEKKTIVQIAAIQNVAPSAILSLLKKYEIPRRKKGRITQNIQNHVLDNSLMNRIFCGDNAELCKKIPDNSIDLSLQSPPYHDLRAYKGFSWNFDNICKELYRITKDGGVCVWVEGDATVKGGRTGDSFRHALGFQSIGWKIHDVIIYEKNGAAFPARRDGNRYTNIFEYMFVFSKRKPKTAHLICDKPNRWVGWTSFGKIRKRGKNGEVIETVNKPIPEFSPRNNIWRYNTGKGFSTKDKIAFEHPAIFGDLLARDHILSWSNEGDVVLDSFGGSGTTGVMAHELKRNFILMDCSPEYCNLMQRRFKERFGIDVPIC